jgi:dTDP-4-dehydrorhamnose 3,5-epimerase
VSSVRRTTSIAGVEIHPLEAHPDDRGLLREVFRDEWRPEHAPIQWHVIHSRSGTLRGVHIHVHHDDWKVVLVGHVAHVFKDLRRGSPTEGATAVIEGSADAHEAIVIPRGVAHGLYAFNDSITMVGVNRYYDGKDDFACHWADPELGIGWPAEPAILSERDRTAGSLRDLIALLEPWQPI